jgi:tetratricopeptide (TPR) repeat protein
LARSTAAWVVGSALAAVALAAVLWLAGAGGSGAARLAMWQGTQKLVAARPLLGYGPDSLGLVFPRVYPPELVYHHGRGLVVDRAHNLVLDWTVTLGILGLFAGGTFLFVVLRSGWRSLAAHEADGARELLVIGALSALVGNLVGNLVSFDVLPTLAASWMLAGVVVALEQVGQAPGPTGSEVGSRPGQPLGMARAVVIVLIGLVTIVAIAALSLRPLLGDFLAHHAARLVGAGEWSAAVEAAEESVKYFPVEPVYRQQLGWLHLQLAKAGGPDALEHLAAAQRALEEAVALRPGDYLLAAALAEFHGLAALRFDRRHLAAAEAAWRTVTTLAPNHGSHFLNWGRLRLQAGDSDGAMPLLRKAVDLDATDAEAWLLLADLELQRQQPASALVMYRQAAKHAPGRPGPLVGLARVYWLLGQPEAARQAVLQALELDPQNAAAMTLREQFSEAWQIEPGTSE